MTEHTQEVIVQPVDKAKVRKLVRVAVILFIVTAIEFFFAFTMDAGPLHSHTGTHGINPFIIGLHSYFRTLAGHPDNILDGNKPVKNLRYLQLEQAFEEYGGGP